MAELTSMTHTRTQFIMSLVAGFILGVAIFHLLPNSIEYSIQSDSLMGLALWVAIGMLAMIVLLRVFPFHQHDLTEEIQSKKFSWFSVAVGLSLHTAMEGVVLGSSVRIAQLEQSVMPSLGILLVIALHKPLDAYSIMGLMKYQQKSDRTRSLVNVGYAFVCPLVAVCSYVIAGSLGATGFEILPGYILAFAVGAFLTISLSDILPEIHFHQHDRGKLLIALLAGVGFAWALHLVEDLSAF